MFIFFPKSNRIFNSILYVNNRVKDTHKHKYASYSFVILILVSWIYCYSYHACHSLNHEAGKISSVLQMGHADGLL